MQEGQPQEIMARISADEVRKVAALANLTIPESAMEGMAHSLSDILDHIAKLERLDTSGVEPTSHVLDMENVFREDAVTDRFEDIKPLDNAPAKEQNYFSVPRIIE